MNLKKIVCTAAVMGMALTSAMPAFAADSTQATTFSYTKKNDPTYTVTIPSTLSLSEDGTKMDITASDVAYLDGKKVSVTIAGTDKYRNQMYVSVKKVSKTTYSKELRYQFVAEDSSVIETTGTDTVSGTELASFTDNGTVSYTVKPVLEKKNPEPGLEYTGTMTFGISLVDSTSATE